MILIMITGKDVPGITAALTAILDQPEVQLIDIEQARTHGMLSLSFVIEIVDADKNSESVLKDFLFKTKELKLHLDFEVLDDENHPDKQLRSPSQQFAVTLMSEDLQAKHLARISEVLAAQNVNIDSIRKLNQKGLSCLELIAWTDFRVDMMALKGELLKAAGQFPLLDIAIQKENLYRRSKRLVVMDMDSTLIAVEVIDELAKRWGVGPEVQRLTEEAMAGKIDFDESLAQRVALLKDMPQTELKKVADQISLTAGAEILIQTLKKIGYKIALISGGFSYFGEILKQNLGLDYIYTNNLEIQEGKLTGRLMGPIINADRKAQLLESIAKQEGLSLESVIAIGDGANDIPMLQRAGLGIAFNAKKKTREAASTVINQKNLASILYLLGITDMDIAEVSAMLPRPHNSQNSSNPSASAITNP